MTPPPPVVEEVIIPTITSDSKNIEGMMLELKKLNNSIEVLSKDINTRHTVPVVNNISNNINNDNFNINVFLNETCKNAINLDSFIENLIYVLADAKLMIGSYVEWTCSILQKNLNGLPLSKRPMHCIEGEDPHQQLMHIRQDDKWNISTFVNWLEQIHADGDDDVIDKNPICYALKSIDDEKLKYLGCNHFQNAEYKTQHSRLHREISRQDLKKVSLYEPNQGNYNRTRSSRENFIIGEIHCYFRFLLLYRTMLCIIASSTHLATPRRSSLASTVA